MDGIGAGAADLPEESSNNAVADAGKNDLSAVEPQPSSPIPIRAPVSEELEDGGGSTGSGESFDSALERMAASSTASFDTAASPPRGQPIEEMETARVMPKALVSEDKRSSSSSTSSSASSDDDEDAENGESGENGVESIGETGENDDSTMPVAKVSAEDLEIEDEMGKEKEVEEEEPSRRELPEHQSAQGLRVSTGDLEAKFGDEDGKVGEVLEKEPRSAQGLRVLGAEDDGPENIEEQQESSEPVSAEQVISDAPEAEKVEEKQAAEKLEKKQAAEKVEEKQAAEKLEKKQAAEKVEEKQSAEKVEEPAAEKIKEEPEVEEVQEKSEEQVEIPPTEESAESEFVSKPIEGKQDNDEAEKLREVDLIGSVAEVVRSQAERDAVPETDSEEEEEEEEADTTAALRAFAQAAAVEKPSLGSAGPSLPARPTATARSLPSHESSRSIQAAPQNPSGNPQATTAVVEPTDSNGDPNDENFQTREKLHMIRVKFLRLAQRLGQSANNGVVTQVLYRLSLAEQLRGGRGSNRNSAFSFERASAIAEEQEAAGQDELDFTCTIMVLGKTGVGKSATINSLFDEAKTETNAFAYSTKKVQEITGTVHGIKLRVIDTPGLLPAVADQRHNEKVMASVKRFIKKSPPDIVLYFDRLDMQSRDYGDLPLLRTITDTFGAAIWFNAIVVLTHASSAPPDGPNGLPLSYEMFVAQRSHVVQQTIRQAAGDMRLMNPVSLVENHSACRTNRAGERVLPNGQVWKPQLLLLCFASKILAEANSLLKLQESTPGKTFGMRSKVPPLPFLLSSLLQSRPPLKHPEDTGFDEDETDDDIEDAEDSEGEEDYDDLPAFRRLTREELDQLDKKNRDAYFEELHLREKLYQKKQWKEELRRRKEMRKRGASSTASDDFQAPADDGYDEENKSAAVPVALPDMSLPLSFDSDNPVHRYRSIESGSQWLVRPIAETHGWDHEHGYDTFNLERIFSMGKMPASISGQITKDKKDTNLTMECATSMKHGEGKISQAGLDVQTVGKDLSYTLRTETRFNNFRKNKTIAGLAMTMIGETLALGMKLEDRLMIGKRIKVVMNGGALTGKGDTAYGGTVEISLRDKDFPVGRSLSTLGFSVMNWHGDMAVGGNLQTQFMVGRTLLVARGNLNNRGAGQVTIKANSSEQLQIALVGLLPIIRALVNTRFGMGNAQQI